MQDAHLFQRLLDRSVDAWALLDEQGNVRYMLTFEGREPPHAGSPAMVMFDSIHADDRRALGRFYRDVTTKPGQQAPLEIRVQRVDGSWRFVELYATNLLDDPMVHGVLIQGRDVTDRHRVERQLRASEQRFRGLADQSPMGIFLTEADARITYMNPAFREIVGHPEEALLGLKWLDIVEVEDREVLVESGSVVLREERPWSSVFRILRPGGTVRWVRGRAAPLRDEDRMLTGYVGTLEDITDQRLFEERLVHLAGHDPLTGVPNRALFLERLRQAFASSRRLGGSMAVMFVDLDGFKAVNDRLGHAAGDELLVAIGARLQRLLRAGDTVGRLGGDEFAILCEGIADRAEIDVIAQRVSTVIREPVTIAGEAVNVGGSVGVVLARDDHGSAEEIVHEADRAMYRAKARGGSRVVYYAPEASVRPVGSASSDDHSLEQASLEVRFQPIVSVNTGHPIGYEAVVVRARAAAANRRRVHGDDHRLQPPPVRVDRPGLGLLASACRLVPVRTLIAGSARLHVDLPLYTSEAPVLLESVCRILADSQLPADRLVIEIPESDVQRDIAAVIPFMNGLHELGIGVAIDDFGVGQTSFRRIRELPIDFIKLQPTLVQRIAHDRFERAVVATVMELAHSLGFAVIADGVESIDQLAPLHAVGCDAAQGPYLDGYRTAEEIADLLR